MGEEQAQKLADDMDLAALAYANYSVFSQEFPRGWCIIVDARRAPMGVQ